MEARQLISILTLNRAYLKILQKNRYSIHTVLRKRCSSNITLSSLVGPGLFNRQLKAVENPRRLFLI